MWVGKQTFLGDYDGVKKHRRWVKQVIYVWFGVYRASQSDSVVPFCVIGCFILFLGKETIPVYVV